MPGPRRVLVLAYFFPPLGGAGVQRSLKFVRYLPEHGWQASVITTRSRRYGLIDESLAAELPPGTAVRRVADVPLPTWFAGVLRRLGLRDAAAVAGWPDISLGWAAAAVVAGLREIRRARPDAILTSAPPASAHLAGWMLQRLTGIPWVADFRDPWATNAGADAGPRMRRELTRRAEARVVRDAAGVVVVGDYFDILGAPADDPRRKTITNGVDEADIVTSRGAEPPTDLFRLAHVGSLYGERDAAPVLSALRRLADRGTIDPGRFELRIVGNASLPDLQAESPVPVVRTGYVDHPSAVAEMRAASALLLYVSPGSLAPSGKLFEYLAAERPVLCVARRENLAFALVEEWDAGRCAAPDDGPGIEAAIADLYERWRNGRLGPVEGGRERVLGRYSRTALAGELAAVLEEASRR